MNEQLNHPVRIHEQLAQYWQSLAKDGQLPREAAIDPKALADVWDHCFLVSARADGSFAYNYLGPALIDAYGDDMTGREIADTLLGQHPRSLFHHFQQVARDGAPATDESEFVNSRGVTVKYRSSILPLAGTEGNEVRFLLGGMKWKSY